jgi:energy-coupling factor transporter ATP-binding protein EcfA2
MLEFENVSKSFWTGSQRKVILDRVSFRVELGNSIGILAPNGTGKTTLINMMAGLEKPDEGDIRRSCNISFPLGFMGGVVGKVSAMENSRFIARLYGLDPDYVESFCRWLCGLGEYFDQPLGDTSKGEREIDAQTWSCTEYVGKTMNKSDTIFGVNFIDGRIKGYPNFDMKTRTNKKMYHRLVRGNDEYGKNQFVNNQDGTISDLSTGLMWQIADDGKTRNWKDSLAYSQNLDLAEHTDWRLPNAKELQSIIDYSRSPQTTNSPAISEAFKLTSFIDSLEKENDTKQWEARYNPDNQYMVNTEHNGVKNIYHCYLFNNRYYKNRNTFISEEFITNADRTNETIQ